MAKSGRSKRTKHSKGIDRISSLPEPLLSHILSLLPTKYAVATSLLSTRWKFLWTSITNLKFDDEQSQLRYSKNSLDMKRMKFAQFVNRVLLLLNPPCIQNFHLECHHEFCDPLDIDSWVCAAVRLTVQKLELNLVMTQSMELPLSYFHCKTLAVLKLNGDIHFKIAEGASISFPNLLTLHLSRIELTIASNCSVSFPSLKDLLLDSVRYTNEESVHKLFASCSSLESLKILRSDQGNALSLVISIPSLISLTICFWVFKSSWQPRLQIDTPALKYLYVEDDSMCWFTSKNLSSLLEAKIEIGLDPYDIPARDEDIYCTNLFKFIGALCYVKFLSISGHTLEICWNQSANNAPVFRNLSRLELSGSCCWCSFDVLDNLLENMDNLEHLVLNVSREYCETSSWWQDPVEVPTCLLPRATTINFPGINIQHDYEVEVVRYYMKNAKVLKMLTIEREIHGTLTEKLEFLYNISTTPRGSQECEVHVDVDLETWKIWEEVIGLE